MSICIRLAAIMSVMLLISPSVFADEAADSTALTNDLEACTVTVVSHSPHALGVFIDQVRNKGWLENGETRSFKVSAGEHHIVVSDDLFGSPVVDVRIGAGETKSLECGCNYSGLRKALYKSIYFFKEHKKKLYYLRAIE